MAIRILPGDCRTVMRTLPDESVHCVVTSPPYWGLRDYGVAGQLGLETTIGEYVETMVAVFREVRRVLRKDGTLWLNMGDSYAASTKGSGGVGKGTLNCGPELNAWSTEKQMLGEIRSFDLKATGLKPKDLCGVPWRVAFALQADGWWLRQDIIWAKPNPMPESVTDRCTKAHEYLFLLSKSASYFYDAEAVKEEQATGTFERFGNGKAPRQINSKSKSAEPGIVLANSDYKERCPEAIMPDGKRNRRSVWNIATAPFPEAHFATFPPALVEPCIKAGTSEKGCCAKCGAPWVREVENRPTIEPVDYEGKNADTDPQSAHRRMLGNLRARRQQTGNHQNPFAAKTTIGWSPSCSCTDRTITVPCTVLDPFGGAGTTALVADRLGRDAVLIELSPEYAAMAERRLKNDAGLFAQVAAE